MKPVHAAALIVASTLLALASGAKAAAPRADANGDGRISPAEFQVYCRAAILQADTNHDGRVSRQEWDQATARIRARLQAHGYAPQDRHGALFHVIDANNDGFIALSEIDAIASRWFMRLDADHSGFVERPELGQRARIAWDMR